METTAKRSSEKGVKSVKIKPPLESEVLRTICEALQNKGVFFWRANNMPSLGRFGVDGKARFRAMPKFSAKGVADILCVHEGRFIAIEVKREGAKLRPEQAEWGSRVVMNGGEYVKVTSAEQALESLLARRDT